MSEAAGLSARAIRQTADATLADVAQAAKHVGLPWSSGRVGDFESGRIAPSLPTLLAMAGALSLVTNEATIALSDLFEVEGLIQINDKLVLDAGRLRNLLRGEGFEVLLGDRADADEMLEGIAGRVDQFSAEIKRLPKHLRRPGPTPGVLRSFSEGDERIARSLGVDQLTAAAAMAKAWQRTFVQQRDDLAGEGANAQKKGIVARRLKSELKAVIDGDDQ